jgi:hypothetical protein
VACLQLHNSGMDSKEQTMNGMTELEELESIYCDMHKDVYGVKARWYRAESVEKARADIDRLQAELEAQMAQDKIYQQEAIKAFEELSASYGGDIETAKRWQHQAYGTDGDDEFLCYHLGLPYGYFKKAA